MNQTLRILKSRWREVCALLIVMWISESSITPFEKGAGLNLLFELIPISCGLLGIVLKAGFVRTACLDGDKPQLMSSLWRNGIPFFLRTFGFGLLLIIPICIVALLLYTLSVPAMSGTLGKSSGIYLSMWLSGIIFLKPSIYMVPIIVTQNCGILAAWKTLRRFNVLATPHLLVLFCLSSVVGLMTWSIPTAWNTQFLVVPMNLALSSLHFLLLLEAARVACSVLSRSTPTSDTAEPEHPREVPETLYTSGQILLKPHRGNLILLLAMLGLFTCIPAGIAAWVMANTDLKEMDRGEMDENGRSMTNAGFLIGLIGTALWLIVFAYCWNHPPTYRVH